MSEKPDKSKLAEEKKAAKAALKKAKAEKKTADKKAAAEKKAAAKAEKLAAKEAKALAKRQAKAPKGGEAATTEEPGAAIATNAELATGAGDAATATGADNAAAPNQPPAEQRSASTDEVVDRTDQKSPAPGTPLPKPGPAKALSPRSPLSPAVAGADDTKARLGLVLRRIRPALAAIAADGRLDPSEAAELDRALGRFLMLAADDVDGAPMMGGGRKHGAITAAC